jgi:hypothetical protein
MASSDASVVVQTIGSSPQCIDLFITCSNTDPLPKGKKHFLGNLVDDDLTVINAGTFITKPYFILVSELYQTTAHHASYSNLSLHLLIFSWR